jgi:hypothetical protein
VNIYAKLTAVVSTSLALYGCAATDFVKLNGTNYLTGTLKTKKVDTYGFFAGRLKLSCAGPTILWVSTCSDLRWGVTLFDAQNKKAGFINAEQFMDKAEGQHKFSDVDGDGTYFCFPIIPGKYLIRGLGMSMNNNKAQVFLKEDSYLNIPLEVKAGEIAYLGELKFIANIKTWEMATTSFGRSQLVLSDAAGKYMATTQGHCPGKYAQWPMQLRPLDANANGGHPMLKSAN